MFSSRRHFTLPHLAFSRISQLFIPPCRTCPNALNQRITYKYDLPLSSLLFSLFVALSLSPKHIHPLTTHTYIYSQPLHAPNTNAHKHMRMQINTQGRWLFPQHTPSSESGGVLHCSACTENGLFTLKFPSRQKKIHIAPPLCTRNTAAKYLEA